jgi:oxygen-independent coproporphyrinogen-3 oxidase
MLLRERLEAAGIRQYEVSNYARPGFESRHNSSYWAREAYLGLGAGAHSFDGDRTRSWNTPDIDAYVGSRPCGEEWLSDREVLEEKLMLSLRTVRGLDLSILSDDELCRLNKTTLEELSRAGKIILEKAVIRIPEEELFVSDWIISRLFPEYTA